MFLDRTGKRITVEQNRQGAGSEGRLVMCSRDAGYFVPDAPAKWRTSPGWFAVTSHERSRRVTPS